MIRIRSRSILVLLAIPLLLVLCSGRLPAQEEARKFQGEIQVREIGLVIEPPEGKFNPTDLLVFDGSNPRQVLKAEPLRPEGGARPWHVVLYFDQVLAGPETVRGAAVALARQVRQLTGLGSVEVAVADPEPRVALAATADASGISDALGEIADQARKKINPKPAGRETPGHTTDVAALRRQLDRLTAFLAGRPGGGAQALFLVADGFVPPPGEADLISSPDTGDPAPPGTATAAVRETARFLAASGWITFAMPFRDAEPARERVALSDMEHLRVQVGGSEHDNSAPPVIAMRPPDRGPLRHEKVVEVFTRPDSGPLMALTQPTAGTVIGVDDQIRPALDGLGRRLRVWYQAPEALDGKLHTVEVRLPSATTALRGPRWVKSSPPEELDAARARLLAARGPVSRETSGSALKVDASVAGNKLKVRVAPAGAASAGPVRLSIAYDNRSEVHHVVIPGTSLEKGWEHTLDLRPPNGATRVSVDAEDLTRGTWGGTAVDLPRPGS